eukprot:CAMPEP_0172356812 /NCGR_PEP_ID=MMETSP1060-20121228/1195_1 /TAXON_ID=37318 /ORGANISM="Pseudo-nitzschia pungens, Strain cf. cingulata" /LENGTH=961 /DNA_ID=CAMNT_0013077155 /DNA_START=110 /DNA_END=2995 /DNA_ORIENTATION=+
MSSLFGYAASGAKSEDGEDSHPAYRRRADEGAIFTASKLPNDAGLENSCELPFSMIWSPMAIYNDPSNEDGEGMAVVQCDGDSLPPVLCLQCMAYMNPFVEYDKKTGIWLCPLCGHENVAPIKGPDRSFIRTVMSSRFVEYRQAVSRTDEDDEDEAENGRYGKKYRKDKFAEEEKDYCSYVLVVDENLSPSDGHAIAPAVEAIIKDQILNSDPDDPYPTTRIGLIVFGKSISIYQLGISGLASAHVELPGETSDDDDDDDDDDFGSEVEKRAYLAEIQTGKEFTSLRNALSSVFGVSVDENGDESTSGSTPGFSPRMTMLAQKKAARLRKEENGSDANPNTDVKSPWVKRRDESLHEKPKRCTGAALERALDLASTSVSNPSRTSRILLFTNGCPNSGTGSVVNPEALVESGKKKKGRRVSHNIVDTDMLQKAVEYYDELAKMAVTVGIGIDVFCCGVTQLALPAYQAMVERTGGYVLPMVTLDTLEENLEFIIENTYMSRSITDLEYEDDDGADDTNDGPECILDIRTDSFVNLTEMCGSGEILPSDLAGILAANEVTAYEHGKELAVEKGFKIKNLPSKRAIDLSMTRMQMGRVDPLSALTLMMEIDDTIEEDDEYAFFQLIARYVSRSGDEEITRVLSFKMPIAEDVNDFLSSVDDEAMSVALAKAAVYRALHGREETEETRDLIAAGDVDSQEKLAYDAQVDIDATIQRISGDFRLIDLENKTERRSNESKSHEETSSLDFAFPPLLKETLNRLYHLRRGPLISPGPLRSMDDRAEQRALFLRFPVEDCLKMMRPGVWSTGSIGVSSGWDSMLSFPPETLALWDDSIIAADFHDTLFIWSGTKCTASRYDGIREKFKEHLLEVSKNRFPMPELHELSDGDSMSRRFTARLAPSHADPVDNQIVHFPALATLKPDALDELRSKFKFYDSKSDESFRTWFWSVASASNKSKLDGLSLAE